MDSKLALVPTTTFWGFKQTRAIIIRSVNGHGKNETNPTNDVYFILSQRTRVRKQTLSYSIKNRTSSTIRVFLDYSSRTRWLCLFSYYSDSRPINATILNVLRMSVRCTALYIHKKKKKKTSKLKKNLSFRFTSLVELGLCVINHVQTNGPRSTRKSR